MRKKIDLMAIPQHLSEKYLMVKQRSGYPLIPIPHLVLFPDNILPLSALTGLSEENLKKAYKGLLKFGVVSRMPSRSGADILAGFGTEATVSALIKLPDGETGALLKGGARFILQSAVKNDFGYTGSVTFAKDLPCKKTLQVQAEIKAMKSLTLQMLQHQTSLPQEVSAQILSQDDPVILCNLVVPFLSLSLKDKLKLLGNFNFPDRLRQVVQALGKELQLLQLSGRIQGQVREGLHETLKKNFLREQMHLIRKELGEAGDSAEDELSLLKKELLEKTLPESVRESVTKELNRLTTIPPSSPEYSIALSWLGWIRDLPWSDPSSTAEADSVKSPEDASEILNAHHAGLTKVKERILEFIAVIQHKGRVSGQILLLAGPPGIGKTSLGKSIATALGRPYVRVSLGGVRDEAEIRGHRKTYVSAMPGKIIQAMKRAGSCRAVVLLDEIDKLGRDGAQDLSSALLEVLDPEQNSSFMDHYLGLPYDLSEVLFIATANNTYQMSIPLLDRMEQIDLQGYTEAEKLEIAQKHLIPRQKESLSLNHDSFMLHDEAVLAMIRQYTRESGVRQLNRQIEKIGRKIVMDILKARLAKTSRTPCTIGAEDLSRFLGRPVWTEESHHNSLPPGVAVGLAYTSIGGDVLYIESRRNHSPGGKSGLTLTGSLGQVMQESAQAVFSFLQSCHLPGIEAREIAESQVHIHLPAGATPKDGPSAGIALLCAMASLFSGHPLREGLAMTGEITLRGQVLPVGGIREKLLAAHRYGRKIIILPRANWRDLEEIPQDVLDEMTLYPVESMTDALKISGAISTNKSDDIPDPEVFTGFCQDKNPDSAMIYH
ncbi:MAG: endopeptidase La [Deltaproteobacteria bacterium]|nr:endopeptidase La [Deltaproteobacteria bacterium]